MRDLVLIHGMWSTGGHWNAMSEALERHGYRCHAPTLPFHVPGDEPQPGIGTASVSTYVKALTEYVDTLALDAPPVYVGHSMGGLLAQLLAVERPAAGLVLIAPAPPGQVFALHPRSVRSFLPILLRWRFWARPQRPNRKMADRAAWNGITRDQADVLYPTLVWESGRALAQIGFPYLDPSRATRVDYSKLQAPALFIGLSNDRLVPPSVVVAGANAYPYAQYLEIEDMHHWVIDDFVTIDFVDQIDRWILDEVAEGTAE